MGSESVVVQYEPRSLECPTFRMGHSNPLSLLAIVSVPVPPRKVPHVDIPARSRKTPSIGPKHEAQSSTDSMEPGSHNQHQRTRDDHATEIAEDYVEAVAEIISKIGQCRVKDLADRFRVSHVTASRTISRLQKSGLVITARHAPIDLTPQGRELAERCQHRHEIVYRFLLALGISPTTAAIDTEGIEHHVSEETLQRMEGFLSLNPSSEALNSHSH